MLYRYFWKLNFNFIFALKYFILFSRDAIPEAPAVYFCLPTEDNIHRICQAGIAFPHLQFQRQKIVKSNYLKLLISLPIRNQLVS